MSGHDWTLPVGIQEETDWYDPTETFSERVVAILLDAGMLSEVSKREANKDE